MFKKILIFISSAVVLAGLLTIGVGAQTTEQPEKPAVPTVEFKTETEIFLTEINGYEYKIGDNDWQESGLFKELTPNSEYVLYQRVAETDTNYASEASDGLTVKTDCEHRFRAANCLEHKTCTICGFVSEEVGTHDFNTDKKVIVKATPEKDGYIAKLCLNCGAENSNRSVIHRPAKIRITTFDSDYNGKEIKPSITVYGNDGFTILEKNYTVGYLNNINAGKATITVTFKGIKYEGYMSTNFTIEKRNIINCRLKWDKTKYFYNKNGTKPIFTANCGTIKVPKSSISYEYSNNKKVGTGTVKVTFSGNFTGTRKLNFKIYPKVNATQFTLYGTQSKKFTATSSHKIKYTVGNTKIIKLSGGKIKALKNGSTTIKVTSNGVTLKVPVTVKSVGLNKTKLTAYTGAKQQLTVLGDTGKYTWSSSNKSIAKVSSKGIITPLKSGTCYIYAKKGSKTFKCKVTVSQYYKGTKIPDFAAVVGKLPYDSGVLEGFYCEAFKNVTKAQVTEYKKRLTNSGYNFALKKKVDGVTVYTYIKGNSVIAVALHKGEFAVTIM